MANPFFDPTAHGVPWEHADGFIFDMNLWAKWKSARARYEQLGGDKLSLREMVSRIPGGPEFCPPPGWKNVTQELAGLRDDIAADRLRRLHNGELIVFARFDRIDGPWGRVDPDAVKRFTRDKVRRSQRAAHPDRRFVGDAEFWLPHLHDAEGLPADLAARLYALRPLLEQIERVSFSNTARVEWLGLRWTPPRPGLLPQGRDLVAAELNKWFAAEVDAGKLVKIAASAGDEPLYRRPPLPLGSVKDWPVAVHPAPTEPQIVAPAQQKQRSRGYEQKDAPLIAEMERLIAGGMGPWEAAGEVAPRALGSSHGDSKQRRLYERWKKQNPGSGVAND